MNKDWWNSIVAKLMFGFGIVILLTMAAFGFMYDQASRLVKKTTYDKFYSQAEYFMRLFDNEMEHIQLLQADFFNDRKLTFLISPDMNIDEYEKRDCLLSVKERIGVVTGDSPMISGGILYLPKSGYKILPEIVSAMNETDREEMKWYLNYVDDRIHYDGKEFFMVKTGVPKIHTDSIPNHVFVIFFSKDQIIKKLEMVNVSENSGSFWYDEADDVMVEYSRGEAVGRKLLELLKKQEDNYEKVQRVKTGGKNYLVFIGGYGELGLYVQYELEKTVMEPVFFFRNLSFWVLGIMIVLANFLGAAFSISINQPIKVLLNAFERVQTGNLKEHIMELRRDEFRYLYQGFNDMEDQIERLINEVYVQTNLTQRAQMKQLQAQISPHFLYNSFFLLSQRVRRHDDENAEKLANYLGKYFQYLTRNEADYVPLKFELEHAKSYAAIQGARFVNRIQIRFEEMPCELEQIEVPRLILQPLLENAFKYGLENKVEDGLLWVHCMEEEKEWQIQIEDNGEEMTEQKLSEIREELVHGKQGEITGIYNIHMRLQNHFHGHAGLRVKRSSIGGTGVIIFIDRGETEQ